MNATKTAQQDIKKQTPNEMASKANKQPKTGACLSARWQQWRQLSSEVGKWMRHGIALPWRHRPRPCTRKQKELCQEEASLLDREIERMLQAGAIYKTDRKDLVLSSIYTVPKKDSTERRPVINLRWVNHHIIPNHFKMTTMKDVKAAIREGVWMAKIDLKDCFWQVPVAQEDQRFLSFQWRGINYSFRCLPFGLNVSPLFVTKIYRPVIANLQAMGHQALIYIDDMLLIGRTKEECEAAVKEALSLFKRLGVVVNAKKSCFIPAQQMEYLGFTIDSVDMTISTPAKKIINIRKEIKKFLNRTHSSPRQVASILGKINSLADALFPARVHTANLHQFKVDTLAKHRSWDFKVMPPKEARADVDWWLQHLTEMNGRSLLQRESQIVLGTDASDYGWGAWIQDKATGKKHQFGGLFPQHVLGEHINYKELLAVKYALLSCPRQLLGKSIQLLTDNITTLFYINRMGGRNRRLSQLAAEIFDISRTMPPVPVPEQKVKMCTQQTKFLEKHVLLTGQFQFGTTIFATHLPGKDNVIADWESRKGQHVSDWKLHPHVFDQVQRHWGPHSIDLFATAENKQLSRFASWQPNPGTTWVDAMQHSWVNENGWANPPFSLISRILQKVTREGSTVTLVAPLWPAQPWFTTLVNMLVDVPILLPTRTDLFLPPAAFRHRLKTTRTPKWLSLAWRVSGDAFLKQEFQRRLLTTSPSHGSHRLTTRMNRLGAVGGLLPSQNLARSQLLQCLTSTSG